MLLIIPAFGRLLLLLVCAALGVEARSTSQRLLCMVNEERMRIGVPPLALSSPLVVKAVVHSKFQAEANTMSHSLFRGEAARLRQLLPDESQPRNSAENIAAGQDSADEVMDSWMNSDGHRENILDRKHTHFGAGRAEADDGTTYWTQTFENAGRRPRNVDPCPGR